MVEILLHPSIIMKIQRQPYQFIWNSNKPQVSTPGSRWVAFAYVKGSLHSLHTASPDSASSSVTTMSPVLVEAPSENRRNQILTLMAIAFMTATAPVERVKLLMQCQNEIIIAGRLSHPYKGIGDCFARTVRNEPTSSLWRGNSANVHGFLAFKVGYTVADYYLKRPILNHKKDTDDFLKRFATNLAAYSIVVGGSHYFFYPLKYAYTRLATDVIHSTTGNVGQRQFNGLIDVFLKTIKTDGIVGIYRGCNIALVKYLMSEAVILAIRVGLKPELIALQQASPWAGAVLGFGIQTCSQLVTYPLDTVNCRMIMRSGKAVKYKSSVDAYANILQTEGVRSLYKGAPAQVLKNVIILCFLLGYSSLLTMNDIAKKTKFGYRLFIRWRKGSDVGQDRD